MWTSINKKQSVNSENAAVIGGAEIPINLIPSFFKQSEEDENVNKLTFSVLILQGIATSIDALSVGFAIADYNFLMALASSVIIAVVTFVICIGGLIIGKKAGTVLKRKAGLLGGFILIGIGIEIFIRGMLA